MNNKTWLDELSGMLRIPRYDRKIFGDKSGALVGVRDGYLLALGLGRSDRWAAVRTIMRLGLGAQERLKEVLSRAKGNFKGLEVGPGILGLGRSARSAAIRLIMRHGTMDPERLKEALMPAKGNFKRLEVGPATTEAVRTYSFGKPEPSEVSADVTRLLAALSSSASPRAGKCEDCGHEEREIVLLDNVPGYHCYGCQQQMQQKLDASAAQYEARETNLPRGLLYGAVAALVGSVAWGVVAYLSNYIFDLGAILIAVLVWVAVLVGTGKVSTAVRITIGALTVASILFGDVIFYTLVAMKEEHLPFSFQLVRLIVDNLWAIESKDASSVILALVVAGALALVTRKPAFKAHFVPLGAPAPSL